MFKELKNQFRLTFELKVDSPLCIRSGEESIDPTLPDMQCIRAFKDGKSVVFIPGSSIKGVIRSRCEKIFNIIAGKEITCDITEGSRSRCNKIDGSGREVYDAICPACKMFGCMSLGARFKFKDSYPVDGKFKIGHRNGVGINRITGAAQRGALYDFEVVEDATFEVNITGENFELYQLKTLLWALQDINEGYVTFGSSSTRGNGKMLVMDMKLDIRDFRKSEPASIRGYYDDDHSEPVNFSSRDYYYAAVLEDMDNIIRCLNNVDVAAKL